MTALAANKETLTRARDTVNLKCAASAVIYKGAMVCLDTDGYAVAAASTAGYQFIGIATEKVSASSTAGASTVTVERLPFRVGKGTAAQADVGDLVYVSDDQTVATSTANRVKVGRVDKLEDSELWVDPDPLGGARAEINFGRSTFVGSIGGVDSGLRRNLLGVAAHLSETGTDGLVLGHVLSTTSTGLFTLEAYTMVVASPGLFYIATNTAVVDWIAWGS